jgi:VacB/RNase II family 3'-5' exoribonuclease
LVDLQAIARDTMKKFGFLTEFPPAARAEADKAQEPDFAKLKIKDLTSFLWSSIDNDDSRDLDQIEYTVKEPGGTRLYVAIAQVDPMVPRNSAIDKAAQTNTTSIYTGAETFTMLPPRLSTDLTSLVEGEKRLAVVTEIVFNSDGKVGPSQIYPAIVQNKAQLTYDAVQYWLESRTGGSTTQPSDITRRMLEKIRGNSALGDQLTWQDDLAQTLRRRRHEAGALTLTSIEFRPVVSKEGALDLKINPINRATQLIEDLMIAVNQVSVEFLLARGFPTLRRVVRTPKKWDRIVALAAERGATLPGEPNAKRLDEFLRREQLRDPERFPDLSLTVIKLLGRGEYVVQIPGQAPQGHFSLAVKDYSHSTAPNRRYPDVLTQRLLLAAFQNQKPPYANQELQALATRCTLKEDDANKVERTVSKSIAAVALTGRIGEEFSAIVTGASDKGVWVRLLAPPVEGKLQGKLPPLDVGDKVQVKLADTNPYRGYIDFQLIKRV